MTVSPAGLPAWARNPSIETYGGHVDKKNYQSLGPVNPRTDVGAQQLASLTDHLVSVVRTAPFAFIRYQCDDTTPADPTVEIYQGMHGGGIVSAPTATRNGDGDVTLTWASSYSDAYGQSQSTSIVGASVEAIVGTTTLSKVYDLVDARTVRVRIFDAATSLAIANPQVFVTVY